MNKKTYNKKTEKIFSEPNLELTEDLTEQTPALTTSPDQDLTEDLTESLTPFMKVCENLGISRETGYNRMEFLKIKPWKDKNKSFLDASQIAHMNGLHEHYKKHGKFDGYAIPEPSGLWEETKEEINNNQNEINETSQEAAIVLNRPQQLSTNSPSFAPAAVRSQPQPTTEMEAINNLVASAQNKAAGVLIAENVLANQYVQNPDLLPEELKAKIQESAQTPVVDPFEYATSLISFAQGVAF